MFDILPPLLGAMTYVGIYSLLALGLNLEYGFTGMPNFGKVLFYAIGAAFTGAFTTGILIRVAGSALDPRSPETISVLWQTARSHPIETLALSLLSLGLSAIVSGFFGYLMSYPTLRLSGDYLAMFFLVGSESLRIFMTNYEPIAGGVFGMGGIPNPFASLVSDPLEVAGLFAIYVWLIVFGAYVCLERLVNSPWGRLLKSIRDDEEVSRSLGKPVARTKGWVMFIGSALAGLAGSLYVSYAGFVLGDSFTPELTVLAWLILIVGGTANNKGMLVGALLVGGVIDRGLAYLPVIFSMPQLNYFRFVAVGLLLICILMFRPSGILRERPVKTPATNLG